MEPTIEVTDARLPSADGQSTVAVTIWTDGAAPQPPRGIVQLVHGMAEHIGRYDAFARFLVGHGYAVCGHDHIGHGRTAGSPERRGVIPARGGVDALVADIGSVRKDMAACLPEDVPYFMFGHSMGSLLLRCYLAHHGEGLAGGVICGTAMPPRVVSGAGMLLARAVAAIRGPEARSELLHSLADGAYSRSVPDARTPYDWISRDPATVDAYIADEASGFMFSAGGYAALTEAAYRAASSRAFLGVPKGLPVLVIAGDEDPVGDDGRAPEAVAQRLREAGVRDVTLKLYGGMRHEILNEVGREQVYADVFDWLDEEGGRS